MKTVQGLVILTLLGLALNVGATSDASSWGYDSIAQFIRDVGFPIAVAWYILVRMERTLQQLVIAVDELKTCIQNKEEKCKNG